MLDHTMKKIRTERAPPRLSGRRDTVLDECGSNSERTVFHRVRITCGEARVLDRIEVPVQPLNTYILRAMKATMTALALNVLEDLLPRNQRGRYIHSHKGRAPKRGWPGRHAQK